MNEGQIWDELVPMKFKELRKEYERVGQEIEDMKYLIESAKIEYLENPSDDLAERISNQSMLHFSIVEQFEEAQKWMGHAGRMGGSRRSVPVKHSIGTVRETMLAVRDNPQMKLLEDR